jgi:serine/threonine protein kinase, bacterial
MRLRHGRYTVHQLCGVGGMSAVYQANQRTGWLRSRSVALKVAQPRMPDPQTLLEAKQRLAHEAILLRLVDHWRVPRALSLFEEHDRLHLAMEFVSGPTLQSLLADRASPAHPPWAEPAVIALGRALADLLHHLHTGPAPILVRDLKPANLIITPAGHVMLVDLGIACRLRWGEPVPSSERWLGTPGYAAPEQCMGSGQEDERVDLYALGAVLHRVATGRDPARFPGQFRYPPARVLNPALSPRLERLLAALLSPDPAGRPSSAALVAAELAECESRAVPEAVSRTRTAGVAH